MFETLTAHVPVAVLVGSLTDVAVTVTVARCEERNSRVT
jgi:hypothetical protein